MNLGPYEIALIAGGFTIVGTLLGGLIGYRNAISVYRITEFNKAAAIFQSTFVDILYTIEQSGISPGDDGWYDLLLSIYTKPKEIELEKAKIIFEPHLNRRQLMGLNAAWEKWSNWYGYFTKNHKSEQVDFLGHIRAVLEYAKPR